MPEQSILHGVRILDFSWVLAGPFATRLLADYGAEVIKIQSPHAQPMDQFGQGYYNMFNRNKLGITLNLNKAEGRAIAKNLVQLSDAVVENFSPRVMFNWGLDYPELQKWKPDIIYLSLSLMGHEGPWKDYSGFGPAAQAFSGIDSLTALPTQPPTGLGYAFADHVAGLYGSLALLSALEYRRQTGLGQFIDLSETEAMINLLSGAIREYSQKGGRDAAIASNEGAPQGVYRTLGNDHWCAISVTNEGQWERLKICLGEPEWTRDQKFSTLAKRKLNHEALDNLVQAWTSQHTAEEVMQTLQKEGIAAGIVQSAADLATDPQLRTRGFFVQIEDDLHLKNVSDASPIKLAENPTEYRRAAPSPEQDNLEVYSLLLGYTPADLERLRREQII